ncbi:MAG: OmpA family protein [Polyangiaceae bacterium]|nr:OmpA family protein [Polyangiaceae bacterium]
MVLAVLALASCGYSEDEMQAQLAKNRALAGQLDQEMATRSRTQGELDQARARVRQLESQLHQMGVNLDAVQSALQQTGTEKEQLASNLEQLKQALEEYKARAAQLERIKARFELLRNKLKKLTELGLKVEIRNNRMVIRLPGDLLFPSGSDKLKKEGLTVLKAVGDVIRNDRQLSQRYFQVAGHTDNVPLQGGQFRDNWGLSLMRARQVLLYLIAPVDSKQGGGGLSAGKLHAAGYGETDPVAPNSTTDGRQQNRRVELVLMPDVEEMLDIRSLI